MADVHAVRWASDGQLEIDKANIQSIETRQKSTSAQYVLTLTDGTKHAFENPGMDATVAAIKRRGEPVSRRDRLMSTSGRVIGCTLAYLIVFGVIAAVASSLLETHEEIIASTGIFRSNFLPADFSVVAFVFGALCGFLNYMSAGQIIAGAEKSDWTDRQDSGKIGVAVIFATVALLVVFLVPIRIIAGYSLLESIPLTMTYFLSVLAAELFSHFVVRPKKRR